MQVRRVRKKFPAAARRRARLGGGDRRRFETYFELGLMGKFLALCFVAALLLAGGCAQSPAAEPQRPTLTLEQAKQLMLTGQVAEAFQTHSGCVVLTLRNGELESFMEPELDWVMHFARDNGLNEMRLPTE